VSSARKQLHEATLVLGMGGNLDGEAAIVARMGRVAEAVGKWAEAGVGGGVKASSVYRTKAIGPEQADFLNAALWVRLAPPAWQPAELISAVLELELLLGRDRRGAARWGPRKIDLDVLAWGPRVARYEGPPLLEVPHPRARERHFALAPMCDVLDEELELPGTGQTLGQLRRAVQGQRVERTDWKLELPR
jgi:2-amino-4-hydroxy-6-hydroxymethyldihydropteridine diphosphokinase